MASNQSALEQMLQAALGGGGLREREGAARATPDAPGNIGDILGSFLGAAAGSWMLGDQSPRGWRFWRARRYPGQPAWRRGWRQWRRGSRTGPRLAGWRSDAGEPKTVRPHCAEMAEGADMNNLVRYGGMAVIGVSRLPGPEAISGTARRGGGEGNKLLRPHWCRPPTAAFIPARHAAAPMPWPAYSSRRWSPQAQADGVIDEDEQRRLAGRLDQLGMSSADRRALVDQLTTPVDPREIVSAASSPELGLQIYAASVLAIDGRYPCGAKLPRRARKRPQH